MTTNKHTPLPWVVELNPTIPEGIQVAAFETTGEMAGNRHLQIIIRSHNLDADAELIVNAVNNYEALQAECEKLRRDAERYWWLRGNGAFAPDAWGNGWALACGSSRYSSIELDASVDAALQLKMK